MAVRFLRLARCDEKGAKDCVAIPKESYERRFRDVAVLSLYQALRIIRKSDGSCQAGEIYRPGDWNGEHPECDRQAVWRYRELLGKKKKKKVPLEPLQLEFF